jgi:hypothetical protein
MTFVTQPKSGLVVELAGQTLLAKTGTGKIPALFQGAEGASKMRRVAETQRIQQIELSVLSL